MAVGNLMLELLKNVKAAQLEMPSLGLRKTSSIELQGRFKDEILKDR